MGTLLKIINEAISQALQQLRANKLRSFLSLLGISIGIFSIIGVLSAVDSLEDNVRGSLEKLGNDVVYVAKWPWANVSGDWWKYIKRPNPGYDDYEVVREKSKNSAYATFYVVIGFKTLKYKSSSVERAILFGATPEFENMFKLEFDHGRYFSPSESQYGSDKAIIGYQVAEELFGPVDPIGKQIRLMGRKYEVIGVITQAGKDLLNPLNFDDAILVSYNNARKLANLKSRYILETSLAVKAKEGVDLEELRYELKGLLRAHRRLKPREEDNFSINELSMLSSIFDSFFGVLNLLGIVIGAFALLVGGFSVANIMFVSVKERTSIIGVKKALGAKRFVILLEFLIEAIILCLIGGLMGLLLVHLITTILTRVIDFNLYLDFGNVVLGLICSIMVGVISGLVPAMRGANMDPVEAMRK